MASKQVNELVEQTAIADNDLLPIYDASETIPEKLKKLSWTGFLTFLGAAVVTLTNKTIAACTLSGTMNAADQTVQRPKFKDSADTVQDLGTKSASFSIDCESGNVALATLSGTGALTISITNPPSTGAMGIVVLKLTNGGLRTITWTDISWSGGVAPSLSSAGLDVLLFITSDAGTTWLGSRAWKTV